ncbi:MAG: hypothetical protein H8Z69_05115 [Nanohaloarchaea archaeon]|nr:hypothetical protein [Candidatus Nanohaloarchaea archaeon]
MTNYYETCLRETSDEIKQKTSDLGWESTNCDYETVFLEAENWGELKRKIDRNRGDADILVFKGGDEQLNRKAAESSRIDVLLHPEKGRKDSGIDHVVAEKAADNHVAIGFDLKQLLEKEGKHRSFVLKHWRRNLKLCEKYGTPYVITSGASEKLDLRAPRDLKAIIDSLGFEGRKSVSDYPKRILERSENVESQVRSGVEEVDRE